MEKTYLTAVADPASLVRIAAAAAAGLGVANAVPVSPTVSPSVSRRDEAGEMIPKSLLSSPLLSNSHGVRFDGGRRPHKC